MPGDRLVGTGSANQRWNRPQNVRATLNYPSNGMGAVVTYLEISVNQVKFDDLKAIVFVTWFIRSKLQRQILEFIGLH